MAGRGTSSIEREVQRIALQPLIAAFEEFVSPEYLREFADATRSAPKRAKDFAQRAVPFLEQAALFGNGGDLPVTVAHLLEATAKHVLVTTEVEIPHSDWRILSSWAAVSQIGHIASGGDPALQGARWIHEWFLDETLVDTHVMLGADPAAAEQEVLLVRVLTAYQNVAESFFGPRRFVRVNEMLQDVVVRRYLGVNNHLGVEWFNAEAMFDLIRLLSRVSELQLSVDRGVSKAERANRLQIVNSSLAMMGDLARLSEYQVGRLKELLSYATGRESKLRRHEATKI